MIGFSVSDGFRISGQVPGSVGFGCRFGIRHILILKLVFDRPEKLRFVYFHVFLTVQLLCMYLDMECPWLSIKFSSLGLHVITTVLPHRHSMEPVVQTIIISLEKHYRLLNPMGFHGIFMFLPTSNHHGLHYLGIP